MLSHSDNLPPKDHIEKLLNKVDISDIINILKATYSEHNVVENYIDKFNTNVMLVYNELKKTYKNDNMKQSVCNAMNYYLDFITKAIYVSNIRNDLKDDIINYFLENIWKMKGYCDSCECKRIKDTYITHINCLINQLQDRNYLARETRSITEENIIPLGTRMRVKIKMIEFLKKYLSKNRDEAFLSSIDNRRYNVEYSAYLSQFD
ncbi:variable surface protein [Plasmodium gonderi]|uniref:Variable surface protein n=1 Tax=Plasmodium gonderi TaxID=77519 RepID=A0A1Y1JU81_PLAGO|nr:variable surface protein [Plasmodium gonderi]GAW84302.1 variable surface protein [Plasmodium gonderi]